MLGTDLLKDEFKMLVRASRNERFRFIIIQYNHFSLTDRVKQTLENAYPNRNFNSINVEEIPQENFINLLLGFKKGFVFIYEFEKLLEEEYRSLAIGFNQRRDKFSDHPINLIAFLPWGEEYLQRFQKTMPDFFSLANPIIQLKQEILTTNNLDVKILSSNNNFKNSKEALDEIKAIETRLKTLEKTTENLNLRYSLNTRMSSAFMFLGKYNEALQINFNLLNSKDKLSFTSRQTYLLLNDIGVSYNDLGNYKKSLNFHLKSLQKREKKENTNIVDLAIIYNNISNCYSSINKKQKALFFLKKGIEIIEIANDNHNQISSALYGNLGLIYLDLKEFDEAEKCFYINLEQTLKSFGELNKQTATCYNNLGLLFAHKNDYYKALDYNEKALKIRKSIYNDYHQDIVNSYNNIGAIYSHLGEFSKAKSYYEKAYEILLKILGSHHPDTKLVLDNITSLL